MTKKDISEINLENIERYMSRIFAGKPYKLYEYESFYSAVMSAKEGEIVQPILFNKKGALRIFKTFGQMPKSKGKLIHESK